MGGSSAASLGSSRVASSGVSLGLASGSSFRRLLFLFLFCFFCSSRALCFASEACSMSWMTFSTSLPSLKATKRSSIPHPMRGMRPANMAPPMRAPMPATGLMLSKNRMAGSSMSLRMTQSAIFSMVSSISSWVLFFQTVGGASVGYSVMGFIFLDFGMVLFVVPVLYLGVWC